MEIWDVLTLVVVVVLGVWICYCRFRKDVNQKNFSLENNSVYFVNESEIFDFDLSMLQNELQEHKEINSEKEEGGLKLWHIFVLYILSGIIENACVNSWVKKTPALDCFNLPVSNNWFGSSKTYRGIVIHPILTVILSSLICPAFFNWSWFESVSIGFFGRVLWSLGELPNSYLKRLYNIPPGECRSIIQWMGDHCDSTCGLIVHLCIVHGFNLLDLLPILPAAMIGHFLVALAKYFSPSSTTLVNKSLETKYFENLKENEKELEAMLIELIKETNAEHEKFVQFQTSQQNKIKDKSIKEKDKEKRIQKFDIFDYSFKSKLSFSRKKEISAIYFPADFILVN